MLLVLNKTTVFVALKTKSDLTWLYLFLVVFVFLVRYVSYDIWVHWQTSFQGYTRTLEAYTSRRF